MTNRLANEVSPYLRQHENNPVHWFAWGDDAFAEARRRNVPILLSVGYSACHWCHVMAHECFEDIDVATQMNALFVNIKVDREERPDVDAVYMEAVQAMTGRGGWPMTVFMTPDAKPFFGGTYFPKPSFLQLMTAVTDVWENRREDIDTNVDALMQALQRSEFAEPANAVAGLSTVTSAVTHLVGGFDSEWGGFGAAPKFPSTMNIDLLLRSNATHPNAAALHVSTTSLDAMASGGIYDHLGGGFARYSVDREWLVPHFEKMLYDQALLVRVYLHAYQVTQYPRYKQVVEETINYVLRDLTHRDGGFFSAEDADSADESGHHHEGWFYTWTPHEVRELFDAELSAEIFEWYGMTDAGNFEGRNILTRYFERGSLLRNERIEAARQVMFTKRLERARPLLDDKVLTEWNGYMLSSLAEAAAAFNNPVWLAAAIANAEFLIRELRSEDGTWKRSWHETGTPRARHHSLAADLAALIDAFTRLAEATGDNKWTQHACQVADQLLDEFWDPQRGGLFTTGNNGEQLIARQKDLLDNATPSANSTAAVALYRLSAMTGEGRYEQHAHRIMQLLDQIMHKAPSAAGNALSALHMMNSGITEIVIPGNNSIFLDVVRESWRPNAVVLWGNPDTSPLWQGRSEGMAYVCERNVCMTPALTAETLRTQLA